MSFGITPPKQALGLTLAFLHHGENGRGRGEAALIAADRSSVACQTGVPLDLQASLASESAFASLPTKQALLLDLMYSMISFAAEMLSLDLDPG